MNTHYNTTNMWMRTCAPYKWSRLTSSFLSYLHGHQFAEQSILIIRNMDAEALAEQTFLIIGNMNSRDQEEGVGNNEMPRFLPTPSLRFRATRHPLIDSSRRELEALLHARGRELHRSAEGTQVAERKSQSDRTHVPDRKYDNISSCYGGSRSKYRAGRSR